MLDHDARRLHHCLPAGAGLVSVAALLCVLVPIKAGAQTADPQSQPSAQSGVTTLPTVSVDVARQRRRQQRRAAAPVRRAPPAPVPSAPQETPVQTQNSRSGTVGYITTRTTTGTKTDTPLINIPQSVSVITEEFIKDQAFQSFTQSLRYVPGVIPHQGEFNRDQVVIRGQASSADFFVNGVRDDAQYFRDTYNVQRVEVLKGPNAMIFGRGGGGGVINRVLKEADGSRVRDVTLQGGMFNDKRIAFDFGQAINPYVAGRINGVYEDTDSYRKFVHIERYGINPTMTFKPTDRTTVALSYEYFHDERVTDRGVPSQARAGVTPSAANPLLPYLTDPSTFFGHPDLNRARIDAHIANAVIEHDFDNGFKVRNQSRFASYDKFYQNVFPGSAVNAAGTSVNLIAYNNETDRQNLFNQTDLTYKFDLGWTRHTLLAGVEVGRQSGLSLRHSGFFNGVSSALAVDPRNPVTYAPIVFRNTATDANNTYRLDLGAVYVQDQIEITRYLQLIGGVRFDRFDLDSTDRRNGMTLSRADNLASPRAGIVFKPMDNLALYGSYSVSYLPSSGDQFSTLSAGTLIAEPEKFENKEVGLKWDINPRLQFTTAIYDLDRTNQRLPDPNNPGFFILSGATQARGLEVALAGYMTDSWQVLGGYAYTDARIVSATSATVVAGNRVGLVPYNTFTLWNKYQFTDWFAAGVGVIHQTEAFAASDNTVLLPGFTRVDAGIYGRYLLPDNQVLRWQINMENVFGVRYYATADGNNNITPGSPRAVRGSVTISF